ncbi:hypothetical protein [Hydrogenobacter thermophilus]
MKIESMAGTKRTYPPVISDMSIRVERGTFAEVPKKATIPTTVKEGT